MARSFLKVDLLDLSQPLSDYCKTHGLKGVARSEFIRQAIARAIDAQIKPPIPKPGGAIPEGKRKWLRISMAAESYDRLKAAAALSKAESISEYVVRVAELAAPVSIDRKPTARHGLEPGTLDQIGRSNVQLLRIGRNLNQITKSLHIAPGQTTERDRADLREVRLIVQAHVELVSASLASVMPNGKLRGKPRERKHRS